MAKVQHAAGFAGTTWPGDISEAVCHSIINWIVAEENFRPLREMLAIYLS